MENINTIKYSEFRKKIHKKWYDNFLHEFLLRPISNYIVYIIIKYFKFITADIVTIFSLFVSLLAWYLMILWVNNDIYIIFASLLFLSFHLLDVIDWDVARGKVIFCSWKFTNHGAYLDALIHHYYNSVFIISFWYLLSITFDNKYLFYLWITWSILLIINEIIQTYLNHINDNLWKEKEKTIVNSKSLDSSNWKATFKMLIISFLSMVWLSIIFLIWNVLDILLWFNYFKFLFFCFLNFFIIVEHIRLFYKLLKY